MRSSTCTSRRSARSDAEKNRLRRGRGRFEKAARQSGQLVFASIHSVVSLDSSGRLSLVMDRDISKVVHELVDMHILAYTHRAK